jgi:ABC-type enterobactin transport system permease subunit
MYSKALQGFLGGDIDWDANDIRVILIDTGTYTANAATDQFLSSVASGARIAVSGSLTNKTTTNGTADADDVTFTAVTGASIEAILIYQHTGADATARLIGRIDTATGLPVTPNGGDITVQWDNGTNKIFTL